MQSSASVKTSFKQKMLKAREEAIVQTVNRLLAEKGFEAMAVDEVAVQVGIAKASLYKHFASKEKLAAAIMRVLRRAQDFISSLPAQAPPLEQLPALAILYTCLDRACDPVLEFLKMGGQNPDEQIVALLLSTCFDGLNAR